VTSTISEAETEEELVEEQGNEIAQDSFASANVDDSNDDDFLESSSGIGVSEGLHTDQQHEEQSSEEAELKIKREIVTVICKAMMLVNQMHGSFNDIEDVLTFAKDLFFRNDCDHSALNYWPRNWRETEKLLKEFDYKGPKEYFICLDESHPCHWDLMDSPTSTCRHCGKPGSIKYYYLGLSDKIRTWFSDVSMCSKMLAHWVNRDDWINRAGSNSVLKEVWDGMRFSELAWFWNPDAEWMLPCRCKCCGNVISEKEIRASAPERDGVYTVQCEECGTKENYQAQFVRGEPRNIALIGHWDGWQPFGAPGQHSCGKFLFKLTVCMYCTRDFLIQFYNSCTVYG